MITTVRNNTSQLSPLFDTTMVDPTKPKEPVIGPAEPSAPRSGTPLSDAMGKDDFMRLLVAQLKNQDPLNPMDGKDMAAQLAQFSSVEQLMQMNKEIAAQSDAQEEVVTALDAMQKTQIEQGDNLAALIEGQMAVATVGKTGVVDGNDLFVERDGSGSITVDTGTLAGGGTLLVTDATGLLVGTGKVSNVSAGLQNIDLADIDVKPPLKGGHYTYSFRMGVPPAATTPVKTYTTGRITGLRYQGGDPVLMIGDTLSVPFSKLIQIRN